MKICFLTHNVKQDNGAGVFSHRLIMGLQQSLGADVVVFTTEKSNTSYEQHLLPKRFFRNFFILRRIVKECDVVHALDAYPYGIMAMLLCFGMRKKFIITAIGTGAILHLYKPLYAFFLRLAYRRADVVTTVSNFSKNEILKKVSGLSITVITHGVDADVWKNAQGDAAIRERIRGLQPYIISVGSLRTRKGFNLSIRSFAKVKKQFSSIKYIIVGKRYRDKFYAKLQKLVRDLRLENDVLFFDDIEDTNDLAELYKNAELFCLLSRTMNHDFEAFGLVFLEAAACGLPVIGTYDGGVEDAVEEGKNALLVDVGNTEPFYTNDTDPLSSAIISILEDDERKKKMAIRSLDVAQRSDWQQKIIQYADIYRAFPRA